MKDIAVLKIKLFAKKIIYSIPCTQKLWIFLYKWLHPAPRPDFAGWGMTTNTFTPWHNGGNDDLAKGFMDAHLEMVSKVVAGDIRLSQFEKIKDKKQLLQELMWRHYFVYWSTWYAAKVTVCSVKNLVECGVCDGLTVHFAMSAVKNKYKFKSFLYDAWDSMKREFLLDSELEYLGQYSFLSIGNTQRNLAAFQHESVYIKGYIPDSFVGADNPDKIVWLHLDLNSSLPTVMALEFFYERMYPGGIILFDDYAWHSCFDTKLIVDQFLVGKSGVLLPLPTGQAIFFKS